ncbi:MAG: prepilin-type N-terminal cleavage/methylation domain-containing protein [Phycisphaerae bacterium]|nr:prepilin-type N-terminal cleavage/methylation domain-containing protein [Phycisphaerae bacterium]
MTTRRGFTLLEVVLATALGAMVILVCLALLRSMERLERPLAVRQQELADLHRARTVIQRAMSTLVMSDTTPPVNPNARRTVASSSSTSEDANKSAFETTAEATQTKQQQQARPPSRLLLEADQSDELKAMLQQVGMPADSAAAIQRMEVVVDTPPIAPAFRAELGDLIASTYAQNKASSGQTSGNSGTSSGGSGTSGMSNASNPSAASMSGASGSSATSRSSGSARGTALRNRLNNAAQSGAANGNRRSLSLNGNSANATKSGSLRGAFEIRPMLTDANLEARRDGKPLLYELWWSPLPAAKDTSKTSPLSANSSGAANPALDDPRTLEAWGEPVLLADNLVKCRWQFFSSGEKRSAHSAVWDKELPAYVEFEIQTKTGLYENWMFEVGWTKGPELATTATENAGGPDAANPTGGGPLDANGNPRNDAGAGTDGPRGPGQGGPRGPRPQQPPKPPTQPGSGPRYDVLPNSGPR